MIEEIYIQEYFFVKQKCNETLWPNEQNGIA